MIAQHFQILDSALYGHRHWWQFRPFHHCDYPWANAQLTQWLATLRDEELWALDADPAALAEAMAPWVDAAPLLALCREYGEVVPFNPEPNARLGQGIAGRKWAQIQAFAGALGQVRGSVVEWCAGKGHLGRLLAHRGASSVTSIEWQRALCESGQALAQAARLPQNFVQADVMQLGTDALAAAQLVALHACGDLHGHLLRLWAARGNTAALHLAPCCFHLQRDDHYTPFSAQGRQSPLQLTRADLSQAMQQTVTAGARERRLRDRELHWRMAFDELQRSLRGVDAYLPLPTVPKLLLSGDFKQFIDWALAQKQLAGKARAFEEYEQRGQLRAAKVRRMELVAKCFRRSLELWLVLDRACFLQEAGADVRVHAFCDFALTPRNFMIQARMPGKV
ncbi:SAM-dependent methyltransferase [Simiduia sp. 21SJ11W-1]|uniref:methyltransferase n=1 Tax=Simiduia sp. 21SJ11W-1 TaxID=2909669 RepID=UPI00209F3C93|nr:methyltransferase [Simiduia sp. 21SJ11W-1]UTA46966.1 SAM-dependent methyltransferase [Simiduia sp. 21SJ11W-1]